VTPGRNTSASRKSSEADQRDVELELLLVQRGGGSDRD
jgi:hypothetical protein